jgi:hypothetical protein
MGIPKKEDTICLPQQTDLLLQALRCDNQDAARVLVRQAMLMMYGRPKYGARDKTWNDKDLDAVLTLIKGINPKDTVESILAAQYVSLHLKAMAIMADENNNTIGQGIMMVRLSHQALNTLQQYRGKAQTINVNYNVHSEGNAVLNTMIQAGELLKKGE